MGFFRLIKQSYSPLIQFTKCEYIWPNLHIFAYLFSHYLLKSAKVTPFCIFKCLLCTHFGQHTNYFRLFWSRHMYSWYPIGNIALWSLNMINNRMSNMVATNGKIAKMKISDSPTPKLSWLGTEFIYKLYIVIIFDS